MKRHAGLIVASLGMLAAALAVDPVGALLVSPAFALLRHFLRSLL